MKIDIHREYVDCTVTCTCGNTFQTRSTKSEIRVDICNACHPFFTGQQKLIDSGGRVQRFANKFGAATEAVAAREAAKKAERAAAIEAAEAAKKAEREAKAAAKAARAAEFAKKAEVEAAKAAAEAEAAAVVLACAQAKAPALCGRLFRFGPQSRRLGCVPGAAFPHRSSYRPSAALRCCARIAPSWHRTQLASWRIGRICSRGIALDCLWHRGCGDCIACRRCHRICPPVKP